MYPERSNRRALAAAITAALLPAIVQAEPTNAELLQKIEELSQKVLVLERKLEVQDEAAKTATTSTPVVKASPRGFSIASADARNQLKLRGVLHVDGRFFEDDDPEGLKDSWQATRVRPIVEGTLGSIYDFRFTPDFGQGRTVIQDAYVTARFTPEVQVTVGKFKSPVGLERIQSANDIRMVARYQELDTDDDAFLGGTASFADPATSARKATSYGLGLNWYLNENLKWVLNYDRTEFDGGAAGGVDRADEGVFLTRFALGF